MKHTQDRLCPDCGYPIAIRNQAKVEGNGDCDHLYYPEYKKMKHTQGKKEHPNNAQSEEKGGKMILFVMLAVPYVSLAVKLIGRAI